MFYQGLIVFLCSAVSAWGVQPSPPFQLEGVVVSPRSEASLTLVRFDGAVRGRPLAVGEYAGGWRLVEVFGDGALFESGGIVVRLELSAGEDQQTPVRRRPLNATPEVAEPEGAERVADSVTRHDADWRRRRFDRAEVNRRLVTELPAILAQTGLTPRVRDGEMEGLRLTRVPDGTILSESGLVAGDVLVTVNEEAVRGLNSLMGLLSGLQGASELRLVVERGGETLRFLYEIQ